MAAIVENYKTLMLGTLGLLYASYSVSAPLSLNRNELAEKITSSSFNEITACADHGDPVCLTAMGCAYYWKVDFKDKHINKDKSKALSFFQKTLISSLMARNIASYLMEKERDQESHALIRSAATEGYMPSIKELAHPGKLNSDRVIYDSIKWRKVLIKKDSSYANDETGFIGLVYLRLSTPDYKSAVEWLTVASEVYLDMEAQEALAQLYTEGNGVPKDVVKAYMYYDLAGTGSAEAKQALAREMTPEQIEEAIMLSHRWQDEHHAYSPGYGPMANGGGITWKVGR